jgi:hypothetical protein
MSLTGMIGEYAWSIGGTMIGRVRLKYLSYTSPSASFFFKIPTQQTWSWTGYFNVKTWGYLPKLMHCPNICHHATGMLWHSAWGLIYKYQCRRGGLKFTPQLAAKVRAEVKAYKVEEECKTCNRMQAEPSCKYYGLCVFSDTVFNLCLHKRKLSFEKFPFHIVAEDLSFWSSGSPPDGITWYTYMHSHLHKYIHTCMHIVMCTYMQIYIPCIRVSRRNEDVESVINAQSMIYGLWGIKRYTYFIQKYCGSSLHGCL